MSGTLVFYANLQTNNWLAQQIMSLLAGVQKRKIGPFVWSINALGQLSAEVAQPTNTLHLLELLHEVCPITDVGYYLRGTKNDGITRPDITWSWEDFLSAFQVAAAA